MSLKHSSSFLTFLGFLFFTSSSNVSSQGCQKTCGQTPIKYPLGTGSGCGDPRFTRDITCDQDQQALTLTTHTGRYSITSVDYSKQVIYVTDTSMSTCACTRPSNGFGLNWDAPFSFHDDTVFTLLDCYVDESPVFTPLSNGTGRVSLCDRQSSSICNFLYSNCRAISQINLQVSTCCVYVPLDLGPSFEMDLQKLKCSSYSGFYNLGPNQESHPENWNYGIALEYKFNVFDEYPAVCGACERSNGACGYNVQTGSFVCNCPGGINTTSDCFFLYSYASVLLPWISREWVKYSLACVVFWMVMRLR
ncbi:unnamed protein product [Cochlearia groenlandica]